jgi:CRISPR type I-D-associated protein Csc3/Cas10d
MSRPRMDAEQKKMSFSLAFSPNLIAALEKVRGAKSQSVFVEEWLRQHPQIAAELAAMNDPGFVPPVARYEQLMERLLAFYSPGEGTFSLRNPREATIPSTLFIAQKVIIRNHESQGEEIQEQISAAMEAFWLQERRKHGERTARGESLEDMRPCIKEFARYYYQVIFQEMAKGDLKLLQHRFRSLVRGCEAVYRERLKAEKEHEEDVGR